MQYEIAHTRKNLGQGNVLEVTMTVKISVEHLELLELRYFCSEFFTSEKYIARLGKEI